jgi:hypothetical protein
VAVGQLDLFQRLVDDVALVVLVPGVRVGWSGRLELEEQAKLHAEMKEYFGPLPSGMTQAHWQLPARVGG